MYGSTNILCEPGRAVFVTACETITKCRTEKVIVVQLLYDSRTFSVYFSISRRQGEEKNGYSERSLLEA